MTSFSSNFKLQATTGPVHSMKDSRTTRKAYYSSRATTVWGAAAAAPVIPSGPFAGKSDFMCPLVRQEYDCQHRRTRIRLESR